MAKTVEDISTLKINILSQAQYEAEVAGGTVSEDELYFTPSSGSGVSDVEVDGESVVSGGVAEITLPTVPTKVSDLDNDSGFLTAETDPTVPAWAKVPVKPSYNFSEINSKPTTLSGYGITDAKISSGTITLGNNTITPLTSFVETDPIFSASPAHGISSTDISNWNSKSDFSGSYNDLTNKPTIPTDTDDLTNGAGYITASALPTKVSDLTNDAGYITGYTETDPTVPSWAKQNTKPSYTASEVGAVPVSRTVNGKVLSSDITLSASDVSALPSSTVIPTITDTYSGTSSDGMSGKAVKSAIDALPDEIYLIDCSDFDADTITEVTNAYNAGKTLVCKFNVGANVCYAFLYSADISSPPDVEFRFHAMGYSSGEPSLIMAVLTRSGWRLLNHNSFADIYDIPTATSELTNDSGFITGYTETDPVFSSSPASGISSNDITSWNGVAKNLKDGNATGSVRGVSARAEDSNYTMGINAFAEGFSTRASGEDAHAEGGGTLASGHSSHAEGWQTIASGIEAHAEGWYTVASGESSHAEGDESIARGDWSHAQNSGTIANFNAQTTIGKYNDNQSNNAFEIGNGTSDNARSNAFAVDWDGNVDASGDISASGSASIGGSIKVGGHSSAIGARLVEEGSDSMSAISCSAGGWVTIGTITLTAGTWIINCRARFTPTAGGTNYSAVCLGSSTGQGWYDRRYSESTYQIQHSFVQIMQPTETTTYYLRGTCNNAGKFERSNGAAFSIDAVRIV